MGQVIAEIIYEKSEEKTHSATFEENGVVYEKVTLDVPKPIIDFYRFVAHASGHDLAEALMVYDIASNLDEEIQGRTPDTWKALFNLGPALTEIAKKGREPFREIK